VKMHILVKTWSGATWHVCDDCAQHRCVRGYAPFRGPDGQPKVYESTHLRCQECGALGAPEIVLRSCAFCGGHWAGYPTAHDAPGGGDAWFCPRHDTAAKRAAVARR
jgi:hypothetical protein